MQLFTRRLAAIAVAAVASAGVVATPSASAASRANATDRAFVREMVPHHRMAVDMAMMADAQAEHTELKTMAAAVVEDQSAEIKTLTRAARRIGVTPLNMESDHAHETMMRDADTLKLSMDEMGMDMDMQELDGAKPFDRAFIDMMITHHQGAIRMARAERARDKDTTLRRVARAIVVAQTKEIRQMNAWRKQWYGATSPSGGVPKP